MMNTTHGETVVTGTQINNNLYRLDDFIVQPPATKGNLKPNQCGVIPLSFNVMAHEPKYGLGDMVSLIRTLR
jgi:hypothetical protein